MHFSLSKVIKVPGFDKLHVNVIKSVYNEIEAPLMHVFKNSIYNKSFSEKNENCQIYTNTQRW